MPAHVGPAASLDERSLAELRALRALGDHVLRALRDAGARRAMIVSAHSGDGRTRVARALRADLAPRIPSLRLLALDELAGLDPETLEEGDLVLVDGPALLDGPGPLEVPEAWWGAIEGCIVVALAHESVRPDLERVGELLDARGTPRLAVVWNEREHPPLTSRLSELWERMRRALRLGTRGAKAPVAAGHGAVRPWSQS